MKKRIIELDGIRGIAILLVFVFHTFRRAKIFTANGFLLSLSNITEIGWAGVDIFFVLSGFLITGILLHTKEDKNYFKNFYARRILRIFPLYYVVMIGLFLALPYWDKLLGIQTQKLWPFFAIYQQNWLYVPRSDTSPFLVHTWSLAIEEQFYLIWPALVYFLKKRHLVNTSIVIILFSIATRIILLIPAIKPFGIKRFFHFGTFTRFEGMVLGALIAIAFYDNGLWKEHLSRWAKWIFPTTLFTFLVIAFTGSPNAVADNDLLSIFGYTLLALIGGTLIVLVITLEEKTLLRRIFNNKALLFLGKYSYAIYLFHVPVLILLQEYLWKSGYRGAEIWLLYIVFSFSFTVILSLLSWNLLEKHALKLKIFFE